MKIILSKFKPKKELEKKTYYLSARLTQSEAQWLADHNIKPSDFVHTAFNKVILESFKNKIRSIMYDLFYAVIGLILLGVIPSLTDIYTRLVVSAISLFFIVSGFLLLFFSLYKVKRNNL